jgi:hypothetical protein
VGGQQIFFEMLHAKHEKYGRRASQARETRRKVLNSVSLFNNKQLPTHLQLLATLLLNTTANNSQISRK